MPQPARNSNLAHPQCVSFLPGEFQAKGKHTSIRDGVIGLRVAAWPLAHVDERQEVQNEGEKCVHVGYSKTEKVPGAVYWSCPAKPN
jgi:hypothetical protein